MMFLKAPAVALSLAAFILTPSPESLHAQAFGSYEREVRVNVIAKTEYPLQILDRMADLAELSADGRTSQTARLALENEFVALREEIDRVGALTHAALGVRAQSVLSSTLNSMALNLGTLTLVGATAFESQSRSLSALYHIQATREGLRIWAVGSWDRVAVSGTPNGGNCAGGYAARDRAFVLSEIAAVRSILVQLRRMAEESSNGVFSSSERQVRQYDFEYSIEEIEVRATRPIALALSFRTRTFLTSVLDAQFLAIHKIQIGGNTVEESQKNATDALAALQSALYTLSYCR